ncbi:MAG: M20 family metallopeptidase [Candidatus Eremiobacteraeota bacterium]|nr:M20 family metallopeptidase [Candidatus Eremiobacteraeota bacterium]MBV8355692.1 M20 family metallopeptidase [Candidatus Eremiobacteraeota bacterium]
MTKTAALAEAARSFDSGEFVAQLGRLVAIPSESQGEAQPAVLRSYLEALRPGLDALGFACRIVPNSVAGAGDFLLAERIEGPGLPTIVTYGHGDVVLGMEGRWREGLSPWTLIREEDRLYGRGSADNKGQHAINLTALGAVVQTRGRLGFNCKVLIETGEEIGSPGLRELAESERPWFAADAFIGSDGPRVSAERPTIFLGNRGAFNFDMLLELRDGAHHSGNWGGALANPGVILAHALASIAGPRGQILIDDWLPTPPTERMRALVRGLEIGEGGDGPAIDPTWGQPELTPAENVYLWNTFEVLAFVTGDPARPVNAIPGSARAHCQIRFVVGSRPQEFLPALRRHLDARGFDAIELRAARKGYFEATRLDPDHPWVRWTKATIAAATGKDVAILPNLGGSLPNDVFAKVLGLPTIWIPHSYPACSQHAVNEHLLGSVAREALVMMTALFWELGEQPPDL